MGKLRHTVRWMYIVVALLVFTGTSARLLAHVPCVLGQCVADCCCSKKATKSCCENGKHAKQGDECPCIKKSPDKAHAVESHTAIAEFNLPILADTGIHWEDTLGVVLGKTALTFFHSNHPPPKALLHEHSGRAPPVA